MNATDDDEILIRRFEASCFRGSETRRENAKNDLTMRMAYLRTVLTEAVDILDGIDLDVVGVPWHSIEAFFAKYPEWTQEE